MKLEPLPYHVEIATRLEAAEPELWAWFASEEFADKHTSATTQDLLRNAIRLERGGPYASGPNPRRYALAERARNSLGLTQPITLYQMHNDGGAPNAYLVDMPGEIVIAFVGRILELLDSDLELLDLLGHEIAHAKLFEEASGRFRVVDRLLSWLVQRDDCPPEFAETWRRNRLYSEIYCDIGGLIACGDLDATIRGLVKIIADFKDADAASYLKQAQELIGKGLDATRGTTHPELHVRVLAVAHAQSLSRDAFNGLVRRLVSGSIELGALDLLDQADLAKLTRQIVDRMLADPDARSELTVAHPALLFPDYLPPDAAMVLPKLAAPLSPSSIDYLAYVLLDLCAVDQSSSRAAIEVAASVADELGIGGRFRELARQEFKGRRAILSGLTVRAA